ncbi:MAG: hypothetical protein QXR26_06890 [Candidatus Caldarchaeum sp.]
MVGDGQQMFMRFLRRRVDAFSIVLRNALLINPRRIPALILTFILSYVVYLLGALLFTSNFGDALKLVLRREREAVLKLRNNWGQIRMNVSDFLLWMTLLSANLAVKYSRGTVVELSCFQALATQDYLRSLLRNYTVFSTCVGKGF